MMCFRSKILKSLVLVPIFLLATISGASSVALGASRDFPMGPDAQMTPGSLCDHPSAVRYPERLRTSIKISPDLINQHVPALILQPLVENAIKYGVSRSSRPVTIEIKAEQIDDMMVISVSDDGEPMTDNDEGGNGIGLANVRDRLEARYRSAATLQTHARDKGGFIATLTLPLSHKVHI